MSSNGVLSAPPVPAGGGRSKTIKSVKVQNKMPAKIQITAEQLLREAKERQLEYVSPAAKQKIIDEEELDEYRLRKRKDFEDNIRKTRTNLTIWIRYATWEENQHELKKARSVWERALDVDHRAIILWLKYAEMEMRCKQPQHARNVLDRAITILPRVNQFWYKYCYMEEMLSNIGGARQLFEKWMEWHPHEQAWRTYINFELRYAEYDRVRSIYYRFTVDHPDYRNWIDFAKFEKRHGTKESTRQVYEEALECFGEEFVYEDLLISFAEFEESEKEFERCRCIYRYGIEKLGKHNSSKLYVKYSQFEKKHGEYDMMERVVVDKRRTKYELEIADDPYDYDVWFDYIRLLEMMEREKLQTEKDEPITPHIVRDAYEQAISYVPLVMEKRHWKRYIYLWIYYAVFEELQAKDNNRANDVYEACLKIIPHKLFTFGKIWVMYSHFLLRQKKLIEARRLLGTAIGKCGKSKIFKEYIDIEIQLREFDRCRTLYEKFILFNPENCSTWIKYAELESLLGDVDRSRALYEMAINQPQLDMPELLWKSYIDFEISQGESIEQVRDLYERLLNKTSHVKVWLSYIHYEASINVEEHEEMTYMNKLKIIRKLYRRAYDSLATCEDKLDRLQLVETWKLFEESQKEHGEIETVQKLLPKKVVRRRRMLNDNGEENGVEEYFDYIFPDDEKSMPNLRLLEIAKTWKNKMKEEEIGDKSQSSESSSNDDDDDEDDEDDDEDEEDDDDDDEDDDDEDDEDDDSSEELEKNKRQLLERRMKEMSKKDKESDDDKHEGTDDRTINDMLDQLEERNKKKTCDKSQNFNNQSTYIRGQAIDSEPPRVDASTNTVKGNNAYVHDQSERKKYPEGRLQFSRINTHFDKDFIVTPADHGVFVDFRGDAPDLNIESKSSVHDLEPPVPHFQTKSLQPSPVAKQQSRCRSVTGDCGDIINIPLEVENSYTQTPSSNSLSRRIIKSIAATPRKVQSKVRLMLHRETIDTSRKDGSKNKYGEYDSPNFEQFEKDNPNGPPATVFRDLYPAPPLKDEKRRISYSRAYNFVNVEKSNLRARRKNCILPNSMIGQQFEVLEENKWQSHWDGFTSSTKGVLEIYFLRHGQYFTEERHLNSGLLTELGFFQTVSAGDHYKQKDIRFDKIFVSTVPRAIHSALAVALGMLKDVIKVMTEVEEYYKYSINKVDSGETRVLWEEVFKLWNTPSFYIQSSLIREQYPVQYSPFSNGNIKPNDSRFLLEEFLIQHLHRVYESQRYLVIAHANVNRYLILRLLQLTPSAFIRITLDHGSTSIVRVLGNGKVILRQLNINQYIPASMTTR
ncbi:hypothetical protein SNEBB_003909 [Seison nebaliae]|nr:hypothetical protein SNEBB_003909 [Seison nebaliae]